MKKILTLFIALSTLIFAKEDTKKPKKFNWPFKKVNGTFDRAALQRGFQIYREVCSSCHALKYISFRHLKDLGFSEAEIKALAAGYDIEDGPGPDGDMFTRKGKPSDFLPNPYPHEQAAKAANNGAVPPNLSTVVKGRVGGADYVKSLLIGYKDAPKGVKLGAGQYYNEYFSGNLISMAPPLMEDQVEYADGTKATVDQMATDVTTFLAWASEPEMEKRKGLGIKVLLYLLFLTALLWMVKRRVWANIK